MTVFVRAIEELRKNGRGDIATVNQLIQDLNDAHQAIGAIQAALGYPVHSESLNSLLRKLSRDIGHAVK